jgi:hypothetical protein
LSDQNTAFFVLTSIALFFVAAVVEIGGGDMIWKWLRERKGMLFGIIGGIVLFIWSDSNFPTCPIWKSVCSLWRDIYYIFDSLGYVYRQKKTRSI